MLHYKASDIIKRAKDIADLRGTNFISDEECLSLLNENWTNIYSKLINLNDKTFLNRIEIHRGENTLPEDFYQLGFVVDKLNQPIERFTVGALSKWYELVNNSIQLNNVDCAYMYYYSIPDTLTFPKQSVHNTIETSGTGYYPDTPLFYCKPWQMMVAANGATSLKSSKFRTWFISTTQGILSQNSEDTQIYNVLVDYDGNQVVYPVAKKTADSKPTYTSATIRLDGENIIVVSTTSNVDKEGKQIYSKVFYHKGDNDWAVLNLENAEYYEFKSENNAIPLNQYYGIRDIKDFEEVVDGHIYTETYDGYYLDGSLIKRKFEDFRHRTGVVFSVDYETGYGAMLGDLDIYSIFPDTELNFPNNLYYNILSYQLALAFACKQSKDTTFIEKQLMSNWETFANTLNKDGFGQSKIINLYRGAAYV